MNKDLTRKRLAKRHKRHVSRARAQVGVSEPDLRTPEQITEAREKSRSVARVTAKTGRP